MLSLNRIRELEPKLRTLSDEEVVVIRDRVYEMAQLAYDSYKEHKDSNFPVGLTSVDDTK